MDYQTAADLVTALKARVRDTSASKWSSAEHRAAIQSACRTVGAAGYMLPTVYDSITMANDTYAYALPDHVQLVYAVGRRESSESLPYDLIPWWSTVPDSMTGAPYIWLDFEDEDWDIRVYYATLMPVPPASDTTLNEGATLTAADTTITLTSVTGFPAPGWIKIGTEYITYTGVDAANVALTGCTRGVDSTAATHADASNVYAVVPAFMPDVWEPLYLLAESELFRQRLNDAPGEQREECRFQARWARQQAENLLTLVRKFRPQRRWGLAREAMPWKGPQVNDWD